MNQNYKRNFLRAGEIAREVRSFGKSLIVQGASYNNIIAKINHKIVELGGRAAFPPQIALDNVAAHFLMHPGEDFVLSDEVVKLDVGVCYNGAIGDCAVTVDLSGKYNALVEAAEAALFAAEGSIHVGQPVWEIGRIIEETIASFGFTSIKNLSGHGLGYYKIHTSPPIPNYMDTSTSAVVKPGMTFAIEPFATNGQGFIYEAGRPEIFSLLALRPVRSDADRLLLKKIKTFQGLPFATHDLLDLGLPIEKIEKALDELMRRNIIAGYPPLIEEAQGMVAQAENSILVDEHGKVFVTTR